MKDAAVAEFSEEERLLKLTRTCHEHWAYVDASRLSPWVRAIGAGSRCCIKDLLQF